MITLRMTITQIKVCFDDSNNEETLLINSISLIDRSSIVFVLYDLQVELIIFLVQKSCLRSRSRSSIVAILPRDGLMGLHGIF